MLLEARGDVCVGSEKSTSTDGGIFEATVDFLFFFNVWVDSNSVLMFSCNFDGSGDLGEVFQNMVWGRCLIIWGGDSLRDNLFCL